MVRPKSILFSTCSNFFIPLSSPLFVHIHILLLLLLLLPLMVTSSLTASQKLPTYKPNDPIPLTCLARNLETGEHILLEDGKSLKYVPFPTCAETGKPFFVNFLEETDNKTCTIASVDDELFHLLEFYVHHDSPLSCRIRGRPDGFVGDHHGKNGHGKKKGTKIGDDDEDDENNLLTDYHINPYIPLTINLVGKIEKSHIHVSPDLNMIFHLDGPEGLGLHSSTPSLLESSGSINSATAYSISHSSSSNPSSPSTIKLTIGSPLTLTFSIRWFPSSSLPKSSQIRYITTNNFPDNHITIHTVLYCLITFIGTAAICAAYFRGWEMPRRLRRFDRFGGVGLNSGGGVYSGNGYGGYGFGFSDRGTTPGAGKKD